MDTLPVETLQHIFLKTLPTAIGAKLKKEDYLSGFLTALRISHVCSHWRQASVSFGGLWSFLVIECNGNERTERRELLLDICMLKSWLQRSKDEPLNLCVDLRIRDADDTEMHNVAEDIVDCLLSHQRRWQHVTFNLNFTAHQHLESIDITDIPMLVSLEFLLSARTDEDNLMPLKVKISNTPLLQDLDVGGYFLIEWGKQPMHNLKRVACHFSTFEQRSEVARRFFMELLRVAPNLRDLFVEIPAHYQRPQEPTLETVSEFLVRGIDKLTILDSHGQLASWVLPELTLPSLKCLRYTEGAPAGSAVSDLALRSLPPLESLEITGLPPTQDALVRTLRLLPTLQTIYISSGKRLSWLFQELANNHEERKTCPALREIVIRNWHIVDDDEREEALDALCAMLHSRPGHWVTAHIHDRKVEIPPDSSNVTRELFANSLITGCYILVEIFGRKDNYDHKALV